MPRKIVGTNLPAPVLEVVIAKKRCDGLNQMEIVDWFQKAHGITISQSEVSRLETEAVKKKYLRKDPTFLPVNIRPGLMQKARTLIGHENLTNFLHKWIGSDRKVSVEVDESEGAQFNRRAGEWLVGVIGRQLETTGRCWLGVLWSRTLHDVIREIQLSHEGHPPFAGKDCRCIPLCGDPVYQEDLSTAECSASVLAGDLERTLTGKCTPRAPSLGGVWAYLKDTSGDGQIRLTREDLKAHLQSLPGYREIFVGKERLLGKLDAVLTGVGIVDPNTPLETGTFTREMLTLGDAHAEHLEAITHGDIGGNLVVREGIEDHHFRHVEMLNEGLTGITYADFKDIAKKSPGVLVIAAKQLKKARLLLQLAKEGVANEIFTDGVLATAMENLLRTLVKPDAAS